MGNISNSNIPKPIYSLGKSLLLSKENDGFAYYQLGLYYLEYFKDGLDKKKAFASFAKSSELNCADGINALGASYLKGTGCIKDIDKSIELIEKAAEMGCVNAMFNVAIKCYNKKTTEGQYKAFNLFKKCYQKDDYESLSYLGRIYQKGILGFIDINFDNAIKHFELGVKYNDDKSIEALATFYFFGTHPIQEDKEKGIALYKKIKNISHSNLRIIGDYYYHDSKNKYKYKEAFKYYIKGYKLSYDPIYDKKIALTLTKMNRFPKLATKIANQALESYPNDEELEIFR